MNLKGERERERDAAAAVTPRRRARVALSLARASGGARLPLSPLLARRAAASRAQPRRAREHARLELAVLELLDHLPERVRLLIARALPVGRPDLEDQHEVPVPVLVLLVVAELVGLDVHRARRHLRVRDDGEDFEHAQHHADDRGERDRRVQVDQADRRHARRRWWSRWRTKPAAARGGADRPNRGDALEMRAGREFSLLTLGAQGPLPDSNLSLDQEALDAALFVCAVAAVCTHTP